MKELKIIMMLSMVLVAEFFPEIHISLREIYVMVAIGFTFLISATK